MDSLWGTFIEMLLADRGQPEAWKAEQKETVRTVWLYLVRLSHVLVFGLLD